MDWSFLTIKVIYEIPMFSIKKIVTEIAKPPALLRNIIKNPLELTKNTDDIIIVIYT